MSTKTTTNEKNETKTKTETNETRTNLKTETNETRTNTKKLNEINLSIIRTYDRLLLANQCNSPTQANHIIIESLNVIKNYLVAASLGGPNAQSGIDFIKLQNKIELNASLLLLRWLSQTSNHPSFSSPTDDPSNIHQSTHPISNNHIPHSQLINQLITTFVILQGLLHLHPPSQKLFSSEFNLKILLNFLPLALHSSKFSPIALPLLDLLLITFVDSPINSQLFESAGGLEILVQAMKQKGLKTELRVKVLETLWAWWIDEEEGPSPDSPLIPPSMTPSYPSPKFNSAFPSELPAHLSSPSTHQPTVSFNNFQSSHTPHKPSSPQYARDEINNYTSETPSHVNSRGNSRIRPISLPPPNPSEQMPHITSANLSDGHENSIGKSPQRSSVTPSADHRKPILKAKFTITQGNPTPAPSSAMMVKSTSEGGRFNDTPSRSGTSWDPASRLRMMLENTAGEFVPATPHHPRRVRPMTYNDQSDSTPREPHVLHKSHPTPQNQRLTRNDSQHQIISEKLSTRPSDESEDSDQLNISPHRLFAVRKRRTAIKQGNNTPQRLIRHKQSASLGSIQHQFQPQQIPKTRTQSHQSSSEEARSSGSEPERQLGRARDPTVRPLGSSYPLSPQSTASSDHERPDYSRRSSSTLSRTSSLLDPGTPTMGETSARKKITRVDVPSTVRPNRITNTMTPIQVSSSKPVTTTRASSPTVKSSQKEEVGLKVLGQEKNTSTPNRSSRGKSTIAMPLTAMMTPTPTRRDPSNSNINYLDNKNRTTVTGLNVPSSANKRFIMNRPLTPNKSLINQADLESIVNGTDSDVGASIALSPRKEASGFTPFSQQQKKKTLTSTRKIISNKTNDQIIHKNDDDDDDDQLVLVDKDSILIMNEQDKKKKKNIDHQLQQKNNSKIKTGILEKYMANSDELVRSFKEIGVGFNLLNHHS